jgi:polyisoprenoid-binding protein YceI
MTLEKWEFDPTHSEVSFSVRHMMISKVRGRFERWNGTLDFDPEAPEKSAARIEIETASIQSGAAERDAHLRAPDFLDVATYPRIRFESRRAEKVGPSKFRLEGDLTIHDVTRPITLQVVYGGSMKDPWGNHRAGFMAHASFDRKDFGLVWNQVLDAGGVALGDRIDVEIEVEAVRKTAQRAA